jgi:predicted GTPase|tara:strand:- start:631 stop:870 length:240 start_codon:yes stop_codon:yes gene_type:complete
MKDNKPMKHNSKELEEIYNDVFAAAVEYMEEYEVQAIAATYMAIAMRLYKTTLDDKEYEEMIETVMESEVKPYKESKLH